MATQQYDLIAGNVRVFQRVVGPDDVGVSEAALLRDVADWLDAENVTPLVIVLDNQWTNNERDDFLTYSAMVSYDAADRGEPTSGQGPFGDGHEVRFGNV